MLLNSVENVIGPNPAKCKSISIKILHKEEKYITSDQIERQYMGFELSCYGKLFVV